MTAVAVQDRGDRVTHLAWLAPELLLAIVQATPPADPDRALRVLARQGRATLEFGARWLDCTPDVGSDQPHGWLLTATLPVDRDLTEVAEITCEPSEVAQVCRDAFDLAARAQIQLFLAAAPRAHGLLPLDPVLAANLAAMRDIVREPLPTTTLAPGSCVARFESIIAIDEYGYRLSGWFHGPNPRAVDITAVSPEGARTQVAPEAISFQPRPGVAKQLKDDERHATLGFQAYAELDQPSVRSEGWLLEFRGPGVDAVEDPASKPVLRNPAAVMKQVLNQLRVTPQDEVLLAHQVLPTIMRLRDGRHEPQIEKMFEFGSVPASPEVSIVIAVQRVDRMEHQLAQFVRDPEIIANEVIFVAPRIGSSDELAAIAEELQLLYGLPFRLVQLSLPARRPRALNLGASVARGSYLALTSGDVLPRTPGWVEAMRGFYNSSPAIAAVGPKLLHEDDSIAHAGVDYVRRGVPARWLRTLQFAGLARTLHGVSFPRPVDAISDACMMVTAERFNACDGFSELYLGPGDEAGDLCMRLAEADGEIWYFPGAELYNLDRPDLPANRSPAATRFNDWLFSSRWDRRLAWTSADDPSAPIEATTSN